MVKRNQKLYRLADLLAAPAAVTEMRPRSNEEEVTDLARVQEQIRKVVAQGAVEIVQNAVQRAIKDGQYQLIKFLFEIAGLYPAAAKGGETKELSLARMLCHQLGLPESPELESKSSPAKNEDPHPTEYGAVK